jgi:sec-independent protein translocase protein TatC
MLFGRRSIPNRVHLFEISFFYLFTFSNTVFILFYSNFSTHCFSFFLSFQDNTTQSINFYFEAKIYDYLKFITEIYFDCFFSFQLSAPLILFTNYISSNIKLLKFTRKFFYLLILVFSTLTTPPDVFSQIVLFLVFLSGFETLIFINTLKKNLNFLTGQKTKTD